MKFSHQLAVNAFAPWSEQYIQYKKLKKMAKRQRRELKDRAGVAANWLIFSRELDLEVEKFGLFFTEMLAKVSGKVASFAQSLEEGNERRDAKKRKMGTELYLELSELKKFIFLNAEGVRKVVKKFDKLHQSNYLETYMSTCETVHDLLADQRGVDERLDYLIRSFAKAFTDGDIDEAFSILSKSVSDLMEWEKGTIWSDLLKLERNKRNIKNRASLIAREEGAKSAGETPTGSSVMSLKGGKFDWVISPFLISNSIIAILSGSIFYQLLPGLSLPYHAARCLGILLLVSGWWSLGTFPLFVSALAVPLLVVVGDVLPNVTRNEAAQTVLGHMWGGSQAMVLASFALAAALSKLSLDKQLACWIMSIVKNGRKKIMFALMFTGWATSFAIGNMAASVMCLSLAVPVLNELPQLEAATAEYGRRLLIGIAFACNYGGMTSPVASPQNIVAFAAMLPFGLSFAQWTFVAVPTSFLLLVITFWYLAPSPRAKLIRPGTLSRTNSLRLPLLNNDPSIESGENETASSLFQSEADFVPSRLTESNKSLSKWWLDPSKQAVIFLTFAAAGLWMASSVTASVFGDVGLASLLPLMLLFALPGVLTKSDFLSMPWDVCLLLGSGGVLSLAVSRSDLLTIAGNAASTSLDGQSPTMCLIVCCLFVTAVSTCVSHTAAANVLMPFIVELARSQFGLESAARFILPVSLCLSAGMALPVSSCPNMNATAIARGADESQAWVGPGDYIKPGLVLSMISVVAFVVVADPLTAYVVAF